MKKRKILLLIFLLVVVVGLTGCNYEDPITSNKNLFDLILVRPIAWVLNLIASLFNGSFGWGIIFTTIIVRTIAWPIYAKTNDMSLKMQLAKPDLDRLNAKYGNTQDPAMKQKYSMEMMKVYKKYKINPLGCLMPFLQMPIFMAMYSVVKRITIEGGLYNEKIVQTFLGIDLSCSAKEHWPGYILAVLVGITMAILQYVSQLKPKYAKNRPSPVQNSQAEATTKMMKYMNYFMVFMMVIVSLDSNSLALYWIVGNIYSLGQNLINRKISEIKYEKAQKDKFI